MRSLFRRAANGTTFNLLLYFSVTAFVCFGVIAALTSWFYFRMAREDLVRNYESYAVSSARMLNETVMREFVAAKVAGGTPIDIEADPDQYAELSGILREHMHEFPVEKIKIYDPSGKIIYSDDRSLLGISNPDNAKFRQAVAGTLTSFLLLVRHGADTDREVMTKDLLEVYVPVRGHDSPEVTGVFELYMDVTDMYAGISRTRTQVAAGTFGILGVLYAVLVVIVHRGQRIIRRSERQLVEAMSSLATSEERYRSTVENISDIVYRLEFDREWRVSYVNSRIRNLMGKDIGGVIGTPFLDLVVPADREILERQLVELREGRMDAAEVQIRMAHHEGGVVHQVHRVTRWRDHEGNLKGFIGIGVDITERIRLEGNILRKSKALEIMNEVALASYATDAPEEPFTRALARICDFLGFDGGFLGLMRSPEWKPIMPCLTPGIPASPDAFCGMLRDRDGNRVTALLWEGNRVVSRDIQKVEGGEEWASRTGFRRVAVFPLGAIPGAAGFFGVGSRLPGEIPAEVVETLSAFVSQFTLSLGNVKLFSEVNELSLTDQLTGVANRRGLSLILRREMEVCSRYNRYLSLAMVDIDRFKQVNDTHGHAFGDTVLKKVAETLKANVRGPDFVARYGGEEFCVILPFTDEEMGRTMCERLRREIEKQVFTTAEGGTLRVTASFGISSLRRDAANEEELLAHADAALYRAKERGRNRVELYRESATAAG